MPSTSPPPADPVRCLPVQFSLTRADLAYLDRRVAEARAAGDPRASRSGELRKALREPQELRRDVASHAARPLLMLERVARQGTISAAELAYAMKQIREGLAGIGSGDRGGDGDGDEEVNRAGPAKQAG